MWFVDALVLISCDGVDPREAPNGTAPDDGLTLFCGSHLRFRSE
jgi:hypothetical protein